MRMTLSEMTVLWCLAMTIVCLALGIADWLAAFGATPADDVDRSTPMGLDSHHTNGPVPSSAPILGRGPFQDLAPAMREAQALRAICDPRPHVVADAAEELAIGDYVLRHRFPRRSER